jgi:aerobic carbon-monoxide dehydrogenase medium subunit
LIPASFEYERAGSVDDAVALLDRNEDAKLLAGGHSLVPAMRLRISRPSLLVDIGRLDDLSYVREDGDRIAIGALTRHATLERDPVLAKHCALIAETAALIGDPQVRHRGTIGGSLAHGDPASDLTTVLLTLDADFVVHGRDGQRTIRAAEFFVGPFYTALERQEVLTEIQVPKVSAGTYLKHVRREQDWATVGVAAARVDGRVQIGLTSMGPTPLRAGGVEEALAGGASAAEAATHTADGTDPPSDVSASSGYRAQLAQVLVGRALAAL